MRGTESDVAGMISATSSMKTVRDSRTVIPAETQIDRAAPVLTKAQDETSFD